MAEEAPGKKQKLSEAEEKALAGLDPSIRVLLDLYTNRATSIMDDKLQNFKDNFVVPRMEKMEKSHTELVDRVRNLEKGVEFANDSQSGTGSTRASGSGAGTWIATCVNVKVIM